MLKQQNHCRMLNDDDHNSVDQRPEWAALNEHKRALESQHLKNLFSEDPQRFEKFHVSMQGLLFDYSKHRITPDTKDALMALARSCGVEERRDAMFAGEPVNVSENRPALHMALRGSCGPDMEIDGENVADFVNSTLHKIQITAERIRNNPDITDVVNIGIGGSDLGPRMVYKALRPLADGPNVYFISNVDGSALHQRLRKLKPENTLFIISSKMFTTLETLTNANTAKDWLLKGIDENALADHLVAVTSNGDAAKAFGVQEDNIFAMRDWIGGRYSLWSAIGLPIAVACGFKVFQDVLGGAKAMDEHFVSAPLEDNIPALMGMLGVWYRNFWNYPAMAILPYSHDLREFPIYIQQLDMESNGKAVRVTGQPTDYATGPVIFGEAGTNAQHTFMQLLHQSAEIIPADFIVTASPQHPHTEHHKKLLGNALAQSKALMEGKENKQEPHRSFSGNRPSSTLILDTLDGYHLGMLLAAYEHKIFIQGTIWGINSFDQWGVELGKTNAQDITEAFENNEESKETDSSTAGLLEHLVQKFIES